MNLNVSKKLFVLSFVPLVVCLLLAMMMISERLSYLSSYKESQATSP